MEKIRRGFFKSSQFIATKEGLRKSIANGGILTHDADAHFETFGRWCVENGAARTNDNVVLNMKEILRGCLMSTDDEFSDEDRRDAILCLCKATDEIFDEANKNSSGTNTVHEVIDAVRRVYEDRYKMVLR